LEILPPPEPVHPAIQVAMVLIMAVIVFRVKLVGHRRRKLRTIAHRSGVECHPRYDQYDEAPTAPRDVPAVQSVGGRRMQPLESNDDIHPWLEEQPISQWRCSLN